jgi:hypothetical protein
MRQLASLLFSFSHGCGKLPLWGCLALFVSAQLSPLLGARTAGPAPRDRWGAVEPVRKTSPEMQLIEQVLARRGPDLGLTLRQQLAQAISEEARRAGYDPLLILAVIDVESDFEEDAVSSKGAKGLMQIRPSTLYFLAQKEGLKLSREEVAADPALCVRLGIRYLKSLEDRFGDLEMALMAYNAGPSRIRQAVRGNELEYFRRYPRMVLRDFERFKEGEAGWAMSAEALEQVKQ